jgi:hypothetical protein
MMLVLMSVGVPAARAQHGHGDEKKEEEHGKPAAFSIPTTYKAAVAEIEHRLHEIAELIENKKLDKVHAEADVIQKVAKVVGQLALKDDSGVPKDAVKEVNVAGKDLAAKFDAIDKAGDSGDLAGTKKVYDEMVVLMATLQKYVPKVYQCPMKCEGEKTYDKPGKCPKCGMDVQDVKSHLDHEAKHGGAFFMTPDQKHHLEGTLSASNEFRIYFYDEYTKSIPADKFTAEAKAWNKGASESDRKPLKLAHAPDKSFLTGKVDASVKMPLSIKAYVDFKDGQKPQVFDFDFTEPSKEPTGGKKKEHGHGGH